MVENNRTNTKYKKLQCSNGILSSHAVWSNKLHDGKHEHVCCSSNVILSSFMVFYHEKSITLKAYLNSMNVCV